MANGVQNQEGLLRNLRRQLAVAVRSVQWSYAIFWSPSTKQKGVLEWGYGYYNGDIKTRKTVQAMELKEDKIGLQRSEQLRELYWCLLEGETDQQSKRSSASLSPGDLSDAEWYYLVCMSFVFKPGEGLPGRALTNGQAIWLCNAHYADGKVFSRSLLAKSASIQTVVCFPHWGGVIELGMTELVLEDPSLIQHIKTSLLEFPKPVCSEKSSFAPSNRDDDADCMIKVDHEIKISMKLENSYEPTEDIKVIQEELTKIDGKIQDEFTMGSPDDCSNGCEHDHQAGESFLLEGIDGEASQVQDWHFTDDDLSKCVIDSLNSSDHISQVFPSQEKAISPSKSAAMNANDSEELQKSNNTKFSSSDLGTDDDLQYKRILSVILKDSNLSFKNLCSRSRCYKSSFVSWKKGQIGNGHRSELQQKMIKKVLFDVPLMYGCDLLKSRQEIGRKDWLLKPERNEIWLKHAWTDNRKENEKFLVLTSMVPFISKIDKESILEDTIEYLKDLKARIEELESCMDLVEQKARARRKCPDVEEQTTENYSKNPWINKRKACDIEEEELELSNVGPKDGSSLDMNVKITEQDVLVEMRCHWREYLLLDIMDAMNNLNLDAHLVQSSTDNGFLTITLQSKVRGGVASARMIKRALSIIAGNS